MPRRKPKNSRKAGRPAYDPLTIYLYVEGGRQNHGLSAYAFCMRFDLVIASYQNRPLEDDFELHLTLRSVGGRTLYRRFMEAKRKIIIPLQMPKGIPKSYGWPSTVPDDLKLKIEEMSKALKDFSFRDLFPHNKIPSITGLIRFTETGYERMEPR